MKNGEKQRIDSKLLSSWPVIENKFVKMFVKNNETLEYMNISYVSRNTVQ